MKYKNYWLQSIAILLLGSNLSVAEAQRPNILIISVDDMNDWLGCMGDKQAKTPNIDALAKQGLLFTKAHIAAPVCNPSRVSFYTGLYPDSTGIYENRKTLRKTLPDVVTLPQYFAKFGYQTYGGGKTFHDVGSHHDPQSFKHYFWWHPNGAKGGKQNSSPYSREPDPEPKIRPNAKITKKTKRNFDWAALKRPESDWPDVKVAGWAVDFFKQEHKEPFLINVGIFRPHIPWYNPQKYFDMYPLEDIQLPVVKEGDLDDVGKWARKCALDKGSQHNTVKDLGEWKQLVRAYLASISFADEQVGRVMKALNSSKYAENTIVVFWSDHGYHLGEKNHWHKRTLWNRATHIPMIVKAPGITKPGNICDRPVNTLDIYPTLVELCNIKNYDKLQGESLVTWLKNPLAKKETPSITTYKKGNHAVTSQHFRYIRYATGEKELYDHRNDPNEWNNLAANPDYAKVIAEHEKWLEVLKNKTSQPTK